MRTQFLVQQLAFNRHHWPWYLIVQWKWSLAPMWGHLVLLFFNYTALIGFANMQGSQRAFLGKQKHCYSKPWPRLFHRANSDKEKHRLRKSVQGIFVTRHTDVMQYYRQWSLIIGVLSDFFIQTERNDLSENRNSIQWNINMKGFGKWQTNFSGTRWMHINLRCYMKRHLKN